MIPKGVFCLVKLFCWTLWVLRGFWNMEHQMFEIFQKQFKIFFKIYAITNFFWRFATTLHVQEMNLIGVLIWTYVIRSWHCHAVITWPWKRQYLHLTKLLWKPHLSRGTDLTETIVACVDGVLTKLAYSDIYKSS